MILPWSKISAPPYVIAEIGVNHDGSVHRALDLVDAAATAGADAVKLQFFQTDLLMSAAAQLAAYQKTAGEDDPFAMLRRLELTIEELAPIVDRAQGLALDTLVTVFSVDLVAQAQRLPWTAYKIASPDIINKPLLEALARIGAPLILSTGASTLGEVQRAVDWLAPHRDQLAILQCVSAYPAPQHRASIGGMIALSRAIDLPVGYSDHTPDLDTGAHAVAQGAVILEKHLTYDRAATGPDHAASLDPAMFALYVTQAKDAARIPVRALGNNSRSPTDLSLAPSVGAIEKVVLDIERDVRDVSRQSIVARRDIAPGQTLVPYDLTIKRPGVGLPPWRWNETLGRSAARPIASDRPIVEKDLA